MNRDLKAVSSKGLDELAGKALKYVLLRLEGRKIWEAYREAGYTGTSRGAATRIETRYAKAIEERRQQVIEKSDLKAEEVIAEIRKLALATPEEIERWPKGALRDKLTALEQAGRHLKLFTDRHEVTGGLATLIVPESELFEGDDAEP